MNEIICGDCLEIMKGYKDKQFDLVLTDPPYGIGIAQTGNVGVEVKAKLKDYIVSDWDNTTPSQEYFDEMLRVSKVAIIFGGNYFIDKLPASKCWICWDKQIPKNFTKAQIELCWTNSTTYSRIYSVLWHGMIRDRTDGNEIRHHPTQKPTTLLKMILKDFTKKGDNVLDPFMGSGSTNRACKEFGLDCVGIDIEPKYVEIANKRLAQDYLF